MVTFRLPDLPYDYDALEPHIDARTMQIHHTKHHRGYIDKLNEAIEGLDVPDDIHELIADLTVVPEERRLAVRNNGGSHANHSLFWTCLAPDGGGRPTGDLAAAIDAELGGFDACRKALTEAGKTRFGSGWAWLVVRDGRLAIGSTANQDSPLMGESIAGLSGTPILALDVWEHAYYLKYQNRRGDFIAAFFEVVDWASVAERYAMALGRTGAQARRR